MKITADHWRPTPLTLFAFAQIGLFAVWCWFMASATSIIFIGNGRQSEIRRLKDQAADLTLAADRLARRDQALADLRAHPPRRTGLSVVDRGAFAVAADHFAAARYDSLWRELGPEHPKASVVILAIPPIIEGHLNTFLALPPSPLDPDCVILDPYLSPRARYVANPDLLSRMAKLQICAAVARHGRPGAGMQDWLTRTQFAGLRHVPFALDIERARRIKSEREGPLNAPAGDSLTYLAPRPDRMRVTAASCALGRDADCDAAIAQLELPRQGELRLPGIVVDMHPSQVLALADASTMSLGDRPFLTRLQQEIGDERFERLWTTSEPIATAYPKIVGEPMARTLQRYLQQDLRGTAWHESSGWLVPLGWTLVFAVAALLLTGFVFTRPDVTA